MKTLQSLSSSDITKMALKDLDLMGYECWRQHQPHVPGRTFTGKRGLSDIIGFERSTGIFVLCEVKKQGDTLSNDQIELLDHAKKCGCITFLATVDRIGRYILKPYQR